MEAQVSNRWLSVSDVGEIVEASSGLRNCQIALLLCHAIGTHIEGGGLMDLIAKIDRRQHSRALASCKSNDSQANDRFVTVLQHRSSGEG